MKLNLQRYPHLRSLEELFGTARLEEQMLHGPANPSRRSVSVPQIDTATWTLGEHGRAERGIYPTVYSRT